jgi:hypothetical protein
LIQIFGNKEPPLAYWVEQVAVYFCNESLDFLGGN